MSDKKDVVHVQGINDAIIAELREVFDIFDVSGSGKVCVDDFLDSIRSNGFHEKNPLLFNIMESLRNSRKGMDPSMDFAEFAHGVTALLRECFVGGPVEIDEDGLAVDEDAWGAEKRRSIETMFNMLDPTTHTISLKTLKRLSKEVGLNIADMELADMLDSVIRSSADEFDNQPNRGPSEVTTEMFLDFMDPSPELIIAAELAAEKAARDKSPRLGEYNARLGL